MRTIYYFWKATRDKAFWLWMDILSTFGYVALITYANNYFMGRMVDMASSTKVEPNQVFSVYGPLILILILVNVLAQVCSNLQDYSE